MLTIEEIQKEWPDIEFKVYKHTILNDDVLSIEFKNKFIHLPFTDNEKLLSLIEFKNRIIIPCVNAIERKLKNA